MYRYGMKVPYLLPSGVVVGSGCRSRAISILPMFKEVIARLDRVASLISMGPHKNILSIIHSEGSLFNKSTFKWEKVLIYEGRIPSLVRLL
jgi:hypothetical protein